MKISMLGIRGLPSTYSGHETFVSELVPGRGIAFARFTWDHITAQYETLMRDIARSTSRQQLFASENEV